MKRQNLEKVSEIQGKITEIKIQVESLENDISALRRELDKPKHEIWSALYNSYATCPEWPTPQSLSSEVGCGIFTSLFNKILHGNTAKCRDQGGQDWLVVTWKNVQVRIPLED